MADLRRVDDFGMLRCVAINFGLITVQMDTLWTRRVSK